jgi:hypothetical protein
LLSEAKSLKTSAKKTIRLKSTQSDGSHDSQAQGWSALTEANSRATISEDTQVRVIKQLVTVQKSNRKGGK